MNPHSGRDLSPDAFRLVAALESYESHLERLVPAAQDHGRWRAAWRELQQIVGMANRLPQLAVDIVEIARGHVRLLSSAPLGPGPLPRQHVREQCAAIGSLHDKCLALVRQ